MQRGILSCYKQRLFDRVLVLGGNFYVTYNRWGAKQQVFEGSPQWPAFLEKKRAHDEEELFVSDWYHHYRGLL